MRGIASRMPAVLGRPPQGWSSLLLLLAMLALVGASVTEARLLAVGQDDASHTLVVLMTGAGILGYLLARSSLGVVRAHLIGAAVGAAMILLVAGAFMQERAGLVPASWQELSAAMSLLLAQVQADLQGADTTAGYSHEIVIYLLLGAICWTTAQFSAFGIFRYDRGGPAILAIGIVLFLNLYLASWQNELLPVLPQLVLFAALAMLLLMRLQLTHQRYQWVRRHIADTGEVSRLFLRTGVFFVALAIVSASSLTVAGTTGPHDFPTEDFEEMFGGIGSDLSELLDYFGVKTQPDGLGSIGDSFEIQDTWTQPTGVAFRATVDGDLAGNYWWVNAFDAFDGRKWDASQTESEDYEAFEPFDMWPRAGDGPWLPLGTRIEVEAWRHPKTVISPMGPEEVDAPVELTLSPSSDGVSKVDLQEVSSTTPIYRTVSQVRNYGRGPRALTAAMLKEAGEGDWWEASRYPPWVTGPYLQGIDNAATSGPQTERLARRARAKPTAYDAALFIQDELQGMQYVTEGLGEICAGLNAPECVLTYEMGFCQYYASAMAMVLREAGIPSRVIQGFLPGTPQGDGSWVVDYKALHAWVEAYFPGYGWVRFDPTPPDVQGEYGLEATNLIAGRSAGSTPRPTPPGPEVTEPPIEPEVSESPEAIDPGACTDGCDDGDDDALVALIIGGGMAGLLLLIIGGLLLIRLQRLSMADEGLAYRSIVSLATRLGHGPHPAQTEYEYASSLSETLPGVRDDLYLVTTSRVRSSYGQHGLQDAVRPALRRSYRRIRTALLRLSLRIDRSR